MIIRIECLRYYLFSLVVLKNRWKIFLANHLDDIDITNTIPISQIRSSCFGGERRTLLASANINRTSAEKALAKRFSLAFISKIS